MLLIAAVIGLTFIRLSGAGNILETRILDIVLNWPPQPTPKVIVVNITDTDYDKFFRARSPLEPQTLHGLINAIADNNPPPARIAVDIDTSDESFRNFKTDQKKVPVIWEREVSIHQKEPATATNSTPPADRQEDEIVPLDVLAGQNPELNDRSGVPQLRDDPADKLTRYYTRWVKTAAGPVPSFVGAVAECKDVDTKLYYIAYSNIYAHGGINNIPAKTFLKGFFNDGQTYAKFEGKVALLGGGYRDFDRHFTPSGPKTGVEILANAIQTELGSVPIPVLLSILPGVPGLFKFMMFDVMIGCGVLCLLRYGNYRVNIIVWACAIFLIVLLSIFSRVFIDRVASVECSVPVVGWLFSLVFAIVPGFVAVIIVVCTEYLRDTSIEILRVIFRKGT
jgi:CHASE2 domain-containing sensor protein